MFLITSSLSNFALIPSLSGSTSSTRNQRRSSPILSAGLRILASRYGGQVYSLMAMIGAIKSSRIPVATIVEGKAMSCGALLFSFGAEGMRYMDPDATLMIHDVSSGAFGKVEEIKADAKEVDRLNKKVYEMMARNCGKPSDYFLKLVHERGHADWYLDGQEAKGHNIVNELRIPTLTCKIDLKYTLD